MSALCQDCEAKSETTLDQVMRGTTPLAMAPGSLTAWWLAGDNNAERIQRNRDLVNRLVEGWGSEK